MCASSCSLSVIETVIIMLAVSCCYCPDNSLAFAPYQPAQSSVCVSLCLYIRLSLSLTWLLLLLLLLLVLGLLVVFFFLGGGRGVGMFFLQKNFDGKSVMSMFCNVIMLLLLYVHVCVTRTGWKTRPWPKTVILSIKKSINQSIPLCCLSL